MSDEKLRRIGIQLELNVVLLFGDPSLFVEATMFLLMIDMLKMSCCFVQDVCIYHDSSRFEIYGQLLVPIDEISQVTVLGLQIGVTS